MRIRVSTINSNLIFFLLAAATICLSIPRLIQARQNEVRGVSVRIKNQAGGEIDLYQGSYALLIGVSNYTAGWHDLKGVKHDMDDVAAVLRMHGFYVETLPNPTRAKFDEGMRKFIARYGQSPGNRLLFYYAGHGHTLKTADGRNLGYLVPSDAVLPSRGVGAFKERAISMSEIETYAREIESKHALFVFDSCFSGALFEMRGGVPDAITSKTADPVREFITAGTEEQTVPDYSIFRNQFIAALNGEADTNHDGFITGAELGEFLSIKVANYTGGAQTPRYGKIRDPRLDRGDFVFALPTPTLAAEPAKPAPQQSGNLSAETTFEQVFWAKIQDSRNAEDFRTYLRLYPNGRHAVAARLRAGTAGTMPAQGRTLTPTTVEKSNRKKDSPKGSRKSKSQVEDLAGTGDAMLNAGNLAGAEDAYRSAAALEPSDLTLIRKIAVTLTAQKKWPEAEIEYRRLLQLQPANAQWHYELGYALSEQKRLREAEAEYRAAIQLNPSNGYWHFQLGSVLAIEEKWSDAESAYRGAVIIDPDTAFYRVALAGSLEKQQKIEAAIESCRQAIWVAAAKPEKQSWPGLSLADYRTILGSMLYRQKRFGEMDAEFREALRLAPTAPRYEEFATYLYHRSDWAGAEAMYREVVKLSPNRHQAHYWLGHTLLAQSKPIEAESAFRRATEIKPEDADSHQYLGLSLFAQRKWREAEVEYRRAAELQPQEAHLHYQLANVLENQGRLAEAISEYKQVVTLKAGSAYYHYKLGLALLAINNLPEAEAQFGEAVRLDPSQWSYKERLNYTSLRRRNSTPRGKRSRL